MVRPERGIVPRSWALVNPGVTAAIFASTSCSGPFGDHLMHPPLTLSAAQVAALAGAPGAVRTPALWVLTPSTSSVHPQYGVVREPGVQEQISLTGSDRAW